MKRLIRKSNKKQTLYHTTSLENWLQIKEDGFFIPQGSKGAGINYKDPTKEELTYFQDMVFFSTSMEEAKNYGSYFKEPYVILECEIPQSKLLPDKSDCEECETWQESMEKTEQVAVKGKVNIDCVVKVNNIGK
jgi:hypothetical protein